MMRRVICACSNNEVIFVDRYVQRLGWEGEKVMWC